VTIGGPNGMIWVALSTAIVFGLAFSKLITLGLVPALLAAPYRIAEQGGFFATLTNIWHKIQGAFGSRRRRAGEVGAPEPQAAE
jgi:multidrug efflux pump